MNKKLYIESLRGSWVYHKFYYICGLEVPRKGREKMHKHLEVVSDGQDALTERVLVKLSCYNGKNIYLSTDFRDVILCD